MKRKAIGRLMRRICSNYCVSRSEIRNRMKEQVRRQIADRIPVTVVLYGISSQWEVVEYLELRSLKRIVLKRKVRFGFLLLLIILFIY